MIRAVEGGGYDNSLRGKLEGAMITALEGGGYDNSLRGKLEGAMITAVEGGGYVNSRAVGRGSSDKSSRRRGL